MVVLLAVLVFVAVVAIAAIVRTDDDATPAWPDGPRRLPDPSPRDRYAITGMLDRAPVPSWS